MLTDWIIAAATSQGYPVQSTSIPGVAQRTGATTYHIEMVPAPCSAADPRPILALAPGVGDVDLVVASELMGAGRAIAGGFVTPDRTMTIALDEPRLSRGRRRWRWATAATIRTG